ncbi:unannotated protein [freshwater metagenome]|uniref:Unannotated protein n=1 Tax=freshwater metagenome TaxID=449393 RepID=A0A6J7JDU7_9ZZZZ|nr:hypothetical protein [Actinomycetota bacterium]
MSPFQQAEGPDTAAAVVGTPATLLGAGAVLGIDRVPARKGRRAAARPDEDAVTLAAEAAALAIPADADRIGGIIFVTTTPPYLEGAAVQALAELLDLQGNTFALELSASLRDGLAAVRLAASLAPSIGPVLVCASHAGRGDRTMGDGAVALLIGADAGEGAGLARLTPVTSTSIEIRDRWRLPGDDVPRDADRSFAQEIGTVKLVNDLIAGLPEELKAPPVVVGPDARGSATVEKAGGGAADAVTSLSGVIGAAHPLLRLVASLDAPALVVAMSNGLGEAVHVVPAPAGAAAAAQVRGLAANGGAEADRAMADPMPADFNPYSSGPRAWRDRDVDLRLAGLFGPAEGLPAVPGRRHPEGVIIARTADHVYPAGKVTEMAVATMDDGGQYYGQVTVGDDVQIGDRVKLVPRRLHHGGGMIQYHWKVTPCR